MFPSWATDNADAGAKNICPLIFPCPRWHKTARWGNITRDGDIVLLAGRSPIAAVRDGDHDAVLLL